MRSQFATSKTAGRGGRRYLPYAFTEHGAIMAATVLNSPRSVEMSVYVVRAFVRLRGLLASNKELARRLDELEARIEKKLANHDQAIAAILSAIRQLMTRQRPSGARSDSPPSSAGRVEVSAYRLQPEELNRSPRARRRFPLA